MISPKESGGVPHNERMLSERELSQNAFALTVRFQIALANLDQFRDIAVAEFFNHPEWSRIKYPDGRFQIGNNFYRIAHEILDGGQKLEVERTTWDGTAHISEKITLGSRKTQRQKSSAPAMVEYTRYADGDKMSCKNTDLAVQKVEEVLEGLIPPQK